MADTDGFDRWGRSVLNSNYGIDPDSPDYASNDPENLSAASARRRCVHWLRSLLPQAPDTSTWEQCRGVGDALDGLVLCSCGQTPGPCPVWLRQTGVKL